VSQRFWNDVAAGYNRMGPPLLPSEEDVRSMQDSIRVHAAGRPARVLQLGATPRLAEIQWPNGTTVLAVDSAYEVVRLVWPGDIPGRRRAVQGDWRQLPVRDASYDVALGDGSLNCVRYPDGIRAAAEAVRRALGPGGLLVVRTYVRPDGCESPEDLARDVAAGRVATFNQFRFRMQMAVQRSVEEGAAVRDVHRYWHELGLNADALAGRPGWSHEDLLAIEPYRHSSAVHVFPSLGEWRAVLSDQFEELALRPASYVLGDRCPIMVLRSRA
jgi:SAM-dependent methyltransferase